MRGEVWVEGFGRAFVDYGTTTQKNLKGFVRFSYYPLEMATRRATNRAMRLATATGICSVDEIKESAEPAAGTEQQVEVSVNQGQIEFIRNLGRSRSLSVEERVQVEGIGSNLLFFIEGRERR